MTIADRPELLREAYPLAQGEGYTDLAIDGDVVIPLEVWLRDEATLPAGSFVALDRGRIVGFSGLMRHDNAGVAEDGLTVVARDWRRRGLAMALKQLELAWAAENGFSEVLTWTQRGNEGMRKVNERLGYAYRTVALNDDGVGAARAASVTLTDERKRTVEAGYDALADRFGEWMARVEGDPWERFVDELADRLPEGARVLDLGCGNGAKTARLAGRFEVTGVDISERQLELARAAAAGGVLRPGRLREVDFPPRRSTRSPRSTRSSTCLETSSRRCSPGSWAG